MNDLGKEDIEWISKQFELLDNDLDELYLQLQYLHTSVGDVQKTLDSLEKLILNINKPTNGKL